ncbi:MAG: MATE family efflux transporter [Clostridiales bacterium]|nr:MATE family efflux transporter [Clostridiales bacterium]
MTVKQNTEKSQSIGALFAKYVSQNILGMLGISTYIIADTFFISVAEGSNGITALNLVLPLYSLIFAIGSMIAIGSATQFKIDRARNSEQADDYFSNAIFFACIFGAVFILMGLTVPDKLLQLLGGDAEIISVGTSYTRIFLLFGPIFMINYIVNAFVRNDNDPSTAMAATFISSIFNIIFDYILMFPLKMGMACSAPVTSRAPTVGVVTGRKHFILGTNTLSFQWIMPSWKRLIHACRLGVSAFTGEISSGVTTMIFNYLILRLVGNVGVAAYGIVANTSIVATSIFNGISQGSQPLFSDFYGHDDRASVRQLLQISVITSFVAALLIILLTNLIPEPIVNLFNSEGNAEMASYAVTGVRLYFIGYIFAGFNIVGTGILSATENAFWAFITSTLRGFVAIIVSAVILSLLFGMNGVWLSFAAAECITALVMFQAVKTYWKL